MKFAIDPGHNIRNDGGAVGIKREDYLVLQVTRFLIKKLEQANHKVINCLPPNPVSSTNESLRKRVQIANKANADLFVSIHFNACYGKAKGTEIYALSKVGQGIAKEVLTEICKLGFYNRGVKRGNYYVLRKTTMPAILIECAFCDRKEDMDLFDAQSMANAIFVGLVGQADEASLFTPAKISINYDTYLKPTTSQMADMNEEETEKTISIDKGKYTLINFFPEEEGHYFVELKSGLSGFVPVQHSSLIFDD